ncbi:hypothetical protein N657DRAFT_644219 [Parathielavia appendiculata]|uniref:DDE-1 domain-containing protein n=1 Tax=Parathielavia appendiculata TaxID=2587402 RepID=A0AAN6U2V6_9PEZI|nr:hypothetical protein N657DRAFT_644219 [Parathielavia appendiculata]
MKWLKEVYLPQTKPQGDEWRLLVLDEHSSHTTGDFMATARLNKVQLVYLPAHTSVRIRAQPTHSAMSYLPEKGCRIASRSDFAILWVICGSQRSCPTLHSDNLPQNSASRPQCFLSSEKLLTASYQGPGKLHSIGCREQATVPLLL